MTIYLVGYILSLLMGLVLGLVGAGGSILTIPILVYFFNLSLLNATTYSLIIVGITALIGAISYYHKKLSDIKIALIFAVPSLIAVFLARILIIPNLPEEILTIDKNSFLTICFALIMLFAGISMIKERTDRISKDEVVDISKIKIIFISFLIGLLTGIIGAGGGFLIVPALIKFFKIDVKKAIGTSLAIIAINAMVGFKSDVFLGVEIDWVFLFAIVLLTCAGMLLGIRLNKASNSQNLKQFFSYFVIAIAIIILINQITFL